MRIADTNIITCFNPGSDIRVENNIFYYTSEGVKDKKIKADGALYVYNNEVLTVYDMNNFDFSDCSVKVIDNNADNNLDVVFITESESMFADCHPSVSSNHIRAEIEF